MSKGGLIYLNGEIVPDKGPHISALDRGFTLGDGVFDTLRATGGRVFRLADHLERLYRSARVLGFEVPIEPTAVTEGMDLLLKANDLADALLRITVSRGVPAERGLLPPASPTPNLAITATPFAGYPREWYQRGYRAAISSIRRNESSPLSRIKSGNYLDSVLARMEAGERGAQEALLLNSAGELACGASSNVFLVRDGVLVTPSLDSGVMEGITRRVVLELAAGMGLPNTERKISPEEIEKADELFVTNTAVGVMSVVAVDDNPVGLGIPGPITNRLGTAYRELLSPLPKTQGT